MRIESAVQTCAGTRPNNQDRAFAVVNEQQSAGLFCVADGMGGLQDGYIAAEMAISAVSDWWERHGGTAEKNSAEEISRSLSELFRSVNGGVIALGQNGASGTTLSVLFICNGSYYIAHTGDSRIYLTRKKFFRTTTEQLTHDQTWAADKLREGSLSLQEIRANPKRNMLTGCLGVFEEPRIFLSRGKIKKPGTFIICSDGLYRPLTREDITEAVRTAPDVSAIAESLMQTAEARGTQDDATVVVGRVASKISETVLK